jgi:hypothetical protein
MIKKINYAIQTVKDVSSGISNGEDLLASSEEYDKRLKTCEGCPKLKKIATIKQCGECGCLIAAKAKLLNAKCPDSKW